MIPGTLLNPRAQIDFPTINVLGFVAYLASNSALFFSPTIRSQYAARNPVSPEPTVRANDVAFAAHAVVLSALTWSMFWGPLWGLEQGGRGRGQRVSRGVVGIAIGCSAAVVWVVGLVLVKGIDEGADAGRWAWIDVVSDLVRLRGAASVEDII